MRSVSLNRLLGTTELARFTAYTKWSVVGLVAVMGGAAMLTAFARPGEPGAGVHLGGVLLAAAGLPIAWRGFDDRPFPAWVSNGWLAAGVALTGYVAYTAPTDTPVALYGTACAAFIAGVFGRRWCGWALAGVALAATRIGDAPTSAAVVLLIATGFMYGTGALTTWSLRLVEQLDLSRQEVAGLEVERERLRFSQDVHDVIGRALSAIAVKSELAVALAKRGDPRAAQQMSEVVTLSHEALADARRLARGYREVDLERELAGSRSLLEHAGAQVVIDGSADLVPPAWQEPVAWVVREATTNILRHAAATRVTVSVGAAHVSVTNNGSRASGVDGDSAGLTLLRDRLRPDGELSWTRAGDSFTLTARFTEAMS